jgi:hypothetical protein
LVWANALFLLPAWAADAGTASDASDVAITAAAAAPHHLFRMTSELPRLALICDALSLGQGLPGAIPLVSRTGIPIGDATSPQARAPGR